jgi:anti-sigma factor ChrR (cupin superfamily)
MVSNMIMHINADFSKRVAIRPEDYQWVDSPMPGVERMMLDRIGDEVAHATSLVRYAPNSTFSPHVHSGGEEFFVLEGEFGDEHQLYPAGTYVRNPIGTSHSPRVGNDGCVILVKLHQFDSEDTASVVINTLDGEWTPRYAPGLEVMALHKYQDENVALIRWAPNSSVPEHVHQGGEEVFVIEGWFGDEHGEYPAGTWVRLPDQSSHNAFTRDEGALLFIKVGHLPKIA